MNVSVVDLVTVRQVSLYAEVLALFGRSDPALATPPPQLYAVTFRTRTVLWRKRKRRQFLDAWYYLMTVGQPLPVIPLWLTEEFRVMLPLDGGYEETCRILGIS